MRTYPTIIMIILFSLSSFAQKDKQNGKMYTVKGVVTDKNSKDTIPGVILEFMNKENERIRATRSDFDGMFYTSFCSKALLNDSLFIKTTMALYKQEILSYNIVSDTVINIYMNSDSNKAFSKEKYREYYRIVSYSDPECGLIEDVVDEFEYEKNLKKYQHYCTGEIKKYKDIINDNGILSEWILIE